MLRILLVAFGFSSLVYAAAKIGKVAVTGAGGWDVLIGVCSMSVGLLLLLLALADKIAIGIEPMDEGSE